MRKPSGAPRRAALLASISTLAIAVTPGLAQAQSELDELIVTATRRDTTVQETPINIAAVGGVEIAKQGIDDLSELANFIPGVHLVDQGGRTSDRIIVRGLNVDTLSQTDVLGNNAGGTVSTYLGEIPIYIDLKLNDMERVEFLLGPQGTLYGAGTMGGAIRYIPRRPQFGEATFEVRGDAYNYSKADGASTDLGVTFNFPLGETLAIRGSFDRLSDTGYVDYDYVVKRPGISNPNIITPGAPGYDLRQVKDANDEDTVSGRLALRWRPNEIFDANLTYYYQDQEAGARTISSHRGQIPVDRYVSTLRYLEPNDRENHLLAAEFTADLGFAELTSATGYAKYKETGQRDQTNLLITLEYSYEAFPSFSAYTLEEQEDETITQEIRLVSKGEGPLTWLVGGFYNKLDSKGSSKEFTPGFDLYAINTWGTGGAPRPDSLEYFASGTQKLTEKAAFGEISYQFTDAWQVTVGGRYYSYDLKTMDATDLPLLFTSIAPDGRGPNDVVLDFQPDGQKDDGFLYKFNTSYKFTDDVLAYATVSQGYRIGGGNGIAPCPEPLGNFQNVCALPDEIASFPDKTINYELGAKTQWLDGRLTLNGAAYYIDWKDPQLLSATVNGSGTITKNGKGAEAMGVELSFSAVVTDNLTVRGSYAYTKAELTDDAPSLVSTIADPSLPLPPGGSPFGTVLLDGEAGDRLPGSPEHQASLIVDYERPLDSGLTFNAHYGARAITDVFTRVGNRGGAITLAGYSVHNVSIGLSKDDEWTVTLYADNVFDKFAETGASGNPRYNQNAVDENGDPVYLRSYYTNPISPRKVGVRFTKRWGG